MFKKIINFTSGCNEKENIMIIIYYTCVATNDFISLCNLLDSELNYRVGGAQNRLQYQSLNKLDDIKDFYIAYYKGEPVGCSCSKIINSYVLEIKRVFVKKEYRNKRIAEKMIDLIIHNAIQNNYKLLVLETGKILYEAMNLYAKLGFNIIPNFGPYKNLKYSICMEKRLVKKNETI